ncbi:hypothetical protein [Pasteurella multocida]|uniref:hypothetical protein n=1 Tax=Pasteurella multocida TaxID=747 RepID=UPI001E37D3F3|nr:hypothetical protein [Pasteurella multocida]
MAKQFKQAPLPFTGQKRMFLKHFTQVLNDNIEGNGKGWTIIDVFGGSGLLSHVAKRLKPKAKVIYNDFDGYAERLNHITETNQLREILYHSVSEIIPKNKLISKQAKEEIINKIKAFNGYKDVNCLSSWLLFSGQQVGSLDELFKQRFYNCIRQSDYTLAEGYLDGLEVISESFHQLLPRFRDKEKVLLILDAEKRMMANEKIAEELKKIKLTEEQKQHKSKQKKWLKIIPSKANLFSLFLWHRQNRQNHR